MHEWMEDVKTYCKIDYSTEDNLLEDMITGVEEQLCFAIEYGSSPETFKSNPKFKSKFKLAVLKQVKEEYDHRGITSNYQRYPLANGVLNLIHQLRLREEESEADESGYTQNE